VKELETTRAELLSTALKAKQQALSEQFEALISVLEQFPSAPADSSREARPEGSIATAAIISATAAHHDLVRQVIAPPISERHDHGLELVDALEAQQQALTQGLVDIHDRAARPHLLHASSQNRWIDIAERTRTDLASLFRMEEDLADRLEELTEAGDPEWHLFLTMAEGGLPARRPVRVPRQRAAQLEAQREAEIKFAEVAARVGDIRIRPASA
jgi:hypothetical protein